MEGVEDLTTLRKLELYDNQIEQISSLERLSNLLILDLSFNAIREMVPNLVSSCPLLEGKNNYHDLSIISSFVFCYYLLKLLPLNCLLIHLLILFYFICFLTFSLVIFS